MKTQLCLSKMITCILFITVFSLSAQQIINVPSGSNLTAVRNRVRNLNDNMSEDIIVNLEGGTYYLTETLEFNAADAATNGHKIIWKNRDNERPIISGGVEITNWQNEGSGNGIIWASVPDGFKFRQLYVNNEKVKRSKLFDDVWVTATYQPNNKRFIINRNVDQNSLNFDAISEWDQLGNVEMNFAQTFVMRQPKMERFVFASDNIIYAYLSEPSSNQLANLTGEYTFDVYFENNFDFIDEQGEWYLDEEANRVYYKKRGSTETNLNVNVVAPSVERLINIKETEGLTFYGLTFEHSTWLEPSENGFLGFQNMYISNTTGNTAIPAAIHIESSNNIQFERNVIRHTGGTGIMAFDNNLTNLNLIGNAFYETAAGALQLGSDDKKGAILPQEGLYQAVIQNNYFYNIGYDYGAPVIFGTFPYQLDFQNNEMINSLAMGLNLGWGWDAPTDLFYRPIVMYNKFDGICQQGTDSSVYHTRNDSKGALVCENWFDNSIKVANFRKLGRYNNSVNDPKFGNIYIDNDSKDNSFVRNVHTNFSANGYEGQNDLHVYGNDEGPNFLVNELSSNPSIKNNAGLTSDYADIVNYLNEGSIGGNGLPSGHKSASYLVDDRDDVVNFAGSWNQESSGGINLRVGSYLDTYSTTTVNGSEVSLSFTGDGIRLIAPKNSDQATIQIYIDDVLEETLDLSSNANLFQTIAYSNLSLENKIHTLRIRKSGGVKLQIDAFQVFQGQQESTITESSVVSLFEDYESSEEVPSSHSLILGEENSVAIQSSISCTTGNLLLSDNSNTASGQVIIPFGEITETAYVSFDITPLQNDSTIHFDLQSGNASAIKVSLSGDGKIRYYENGKAIVMKTYEANTKYRFKIIADNQTKKYSLDINNEVLQNLDFQKLQVEAIDGFRIFSLNGSQGSLEFDNLIIKNSPIETSEFYSFENNCVTGFYDYEVSLDVPADHVISAPGNNVTVVNSDDCDNNNLLQINDTSSSEATEVKVAFSESTDIVHVQFNVQPSQNNSSIHFNILDVNNLPLVKVGLISNGKMRYYQNGGLTNWLSYDADTKYSFELIANNQTKKYTLIVGDNVLEDLDFYKVSEAAIDSFSMLSLKPSVGSIYIDNLVLSNQVLDDLIYPFSNCTQFKTSTVSQDENILIFPNPVITNAIIQNAAGSKITIYDMNGSIVFTQTISSESELIDLNKMVTGIYYAEVVGEKTKSIVKLIKQ